MQKPLFTITRTVEVSSSHILNGLPEGHKCGNLHGHNYVIHVSLAATELDETGFVLDFGVIKKAIVDRYDHKHLNDTMKPNPTAEVFALEIATLINDIIFQNGDEGKVELMRIEVHETSNCVATMEWIDVAAE